MFWQEIGKFWMSGFRNNHRERDRRHLGAGLCVLLLLAGIWGCGGKERQEAGEILQFAGGNPGYLLADRQNQWNFMGLEQAEAFCKKAEEKEAARMTLIVLEENAFTKYVCATADGKVNVQEQYFYLGKEGPEERSRTEYEADFWEYTDGYLFFGRSHMPGYDGPSECTALRLEPLDETWMDWNREYLLPTGYESNNLFLEDWSEDNIGEVDFYDLFDAWYPLVYKSPVPYLPDENCNVGAVYRIPAEEFESVIGSHLSIDVGALRTKTRYFEEDHTYEYRPRGLYECQITSLYPEVTGGREQEDGTLTLTVRAVDPGERKAAAFTHEVVVRPLENGGFQYVSNRVHFSEEPPDFAWYRGRLKEEEWEEFYGAGRDGA